MTLPLVSVVVLSKNEPLLSETLSRLRPQCDEIGAECVVVDASRGRLDYIRVQHPWVNWIDFTGPMGRTTTIARQRNVGVRLAAGTVIAFCDVGGEPQAGWLRALTQPICDGAAPATCGEIASLDSPWLSSLNSLESGATVQFVVSANLAVSRSAFESAGGFDELFSYGSDIEFGWRLQDVGLRTQFVDNATMSMQWGDFKRDIRRMRSYGFGNAYHVLTHPDRRLELLRAWPDIVAYPLWIIMLPLVILASLRKWWITAAWMLLPLVPALRGPRRKDAIRKLRLSFTKAVGFISGCVDWKLNAHVPLAVTCDQSSTVDDVETDRLRCTLARASIPTLKIPWPGGGRGTRTTEFVTLLWLRVRGVRLLMTSSVVTSPRLLRVLKIEPVAKPRRQLNGDPTVTELLHSPIQLDSEAQSEVLLMHSLVAVERSTRTSERMSLTVLITNEAAPNLHDILKATEMFPLPAHWALNQVAFGGPQSRLLNVAPRRSTRTSPSRRGYKQDPLGALADGWHLDSLDVAILTEWNPLATALAEHLSSMGLVVAAPIQMSEGLGVCRIHYFDPDAIDTLEAALRAAVADAERQPPPETAGGLELRWAINLRQQLERRLLALG